MKNGFTQYSRPHTEEGLRALWTGEAIATPAKAKPAKRVVFGKKKAA